MIDDYGALANLIWFIVQDPNNHFNSPPRIDTSSSRPALPEPQTPDQVTETPSQETTADHPPSRDPIIVRPTIFKPNTHFKGRDEEIKELHKMLMDPSRRSKGTSSVLIQCMPGGGKTHLARQYVFEHKYDYPGGIFWIRSKSKEELEYGYWDIAKTVGLKGVDHMQKKEDTDKMVSAVQTWLSRTQGWLLVLDGIHFDYPDLQNFIPFGRNTSIIYTSTQRSAGEDYQFDNPQVLMLDPLATRDAQELLLEEMDKKKPWTQDDLSRALDLVQLMDRLPLMIHVAALHLKASREPLAKYLRSYRHKPKAGELVAYQAVHQQLYDRGETAALNLMYLLAFFSQNIPVEMLAVGLKALDNRTPVKTRDAETRRASLNSTFKVLIAFALIERNENNETPSASDRSSRSVDMAQDSLDILRIHGIVQAFFVDTLAHDAPWWLERAICVFCRAFDDSDKHIKKHPTTGLPEDYRRFLIQGKKLSTFLDRFERKHPELADSRELLESRLESIQERIDRLSKRTRSTDSGEAPIISVFERTNSNSLSEIESETPPSHDSLMEWQIGGDDVVLETPSALSPTDIYTNPYHWHVTYPYGIPHPNDDISRTVTPQPAPTEVFESISFPDDNEHRIDSPTHHRTIRRSSERRYRDHAGAWRASPQILSDPRVSLSRETARGFIGNSDVQARRSGISSSSSSNRFTVVPTTGSDAELMLNKIKVSTPLQRESTSYVAEKSRTLSSGSTSSSSRPKLIAGRPSYASAPQTAQSETAVEDEPTPTFSRTVGTYPAPSSSYTAETIMRLKEDRDRPLSTDGLAPVKVSSPLTAAPLNTSNLPSSPSPLGTNPAPAGDPIFPGYASKPPSAPPSRTARSSPGQSNGPFYPPPPPIPVEVNTASSLHSQPGIHHWGTYNGNNEDDEEYDHMTHSLPSIRQYSPDPPYPHDGSTRPQRPAVAVHPPPWTPSSTRLEKHPQGYSSQPMSRDPSHQSSNSHGSARSRTGSPLLQQQGSLSSSPGPQIMQRPRSRKPSVVETEPSPRLGHAPGLDSPVTSYSLYNDSTRGRRRTGSAGPYDLATTTLPDSPSRPGFFSRLSRRGKSTGSMSAVAASAGGGNSGRRLRKMSGKMSPRGSPDLSGAGGAFGGVDMSRSGSGGIKLAGGTVVQFGQSTATQATGQGGSESGRGVGLGILE